jgi:hypothetical protein
MSRIAVFVIVLAACAASQEQRTTTLGPPSATEPAAAEPAEDDEVCTEERTTGTMITHTVCRSRAQIEQERRAAEQLRRDSAMHPDGKIRK